MPRRFGLCIAHRNFTVLIPKVLGSFANELVRPWFSLEFGFSMYILVVCNHMINMVWASHKIRNYNQLSQTVIVDSLRVHLIVESDGKKGEKHF